MVGAGGGWANGGAAGWGQGAGGGGLSWCPCCGSESTGGWRRTGPSGRDTMWSEAPGGLALAQARGCPRMTSPPRQSSSCASWRACGPLGCALWDPEPSSHQCASPLPPGRSPRGRRAVGVRSRATASWWLTTSAESPSPTGPWCGAAPSPWASSRSCSPRKATTGEGPVCVPCSL